MVIVKSWNFRGGEFDRDEFSHELSGRSLSAVVNGERVTIGLAVNNEVISRRERDADPGTLVSLKVGLGSSDASPGSTGGFCSCFRGLLHLQPLIPRSPGI